MDICPNWCTTAGDCCSNMFWVCCPQDSGIVCAANPLFCRRDLAEFAEGFIQKKIKQDIFEENNPSYIDMAMKLDLSLPCVVSSLYLVDLSITDETMKY